MAKGSVYSTPLASQVTPFPNDMLLEIINEEVTDAETFTMLTDTSLMGWCNMAIPVNNTADPGECGVSTLGKTIVVQTENTEEHNIYCFGGYGPYSPYPPAFCLPSVNDTRFPNTIHWEIIQKTMSSGTATLTYADDLTSIKYPIAIIPVEVDTAAPDVNGAGVHTIKSNTAIVECGGASEVVALLVGGYAENVSYAGGSAVSVTLDENVTWEGKVIHLPHASRRKPGDLVGEIITKTFADGDSLSDATITAADDCQIIRHIEMVIPVGTSATAVAMAWQGDTGATAKIITEDANTDDATCLVLGR
jgi:hypothetical protein